MAQVGNDRHAAGPPESTLCTAGDALPLPANPAEPVTVRGQSGFE
jgi:hypothetical protein